jgi:hypothetical protein
MKEFMLLTGNLGEGKANLSLEEQQKFLRACQVYIADLMKKGRLQNADSSVKMDEKNLINNENNYKKN